MITATHQQVSPASYADAQCHIAIVTETYPPEINGVALTLARLATGLQERGHTVSIVRPSLWDLHDIPSTPGMVFVPGLPLPGYKGLHFGLPAGRRLQECWCQEPPDVVYVATEGPLGWSAVRSAQHLGIPVVSGFHTNFHRYSQHYHLGWLQPLILRYLRQFHNRTAATLVPSGDVREHLQAAGFQNVHVLSRGVDSQMFAPAHRSAALRHAWGAAPADPVFLYVGRLAAEKNLPLALTTYRLIQQAYPGSKFVLVGDGPLRSALQNAYPDVIFCGERRGEQLAAHYASADVFVFPSETETFGNVTLEAMASGLGVVAYDYAAARMHITPGETGVLAPYGNASAFQRAALSLVAAPQTLQRIRWQARDYVLALDWQRIVERFETLLMGALYQEHSVALND